MSGVEVRRIVHGEGRIADARAPRVLVVRGAREIEPFVPKWDALAESALEPNVFYEPWMCLAALRSVAHSTEIIVALVQHDDGTLIGVFPLVRESRFRGVPAVTLRTWTHDYCFLATPLVHRAHASACIHAFLDWLREESGAVLLELAAISGDGPFHHTVIDVLNERAETAYLVHRESRAILRRRTDGDEYVAAALDGNARRKLRSKERALASLGHIEYVELVSESEVPAWTADFLTLESSGWKGRAASAMAIHPRHGEFFRTVVAEAARRKQLMMLALQLEGQSIAMKCSFVCGEGSFAFKIAYDEAHGRSSPGMLLELENIRRVHTRAGLRWMDSCAKSSSRLFRELWIDRRTVETLVIATGKERGRLLLSLVPFARWVKRRAQGSVVAATTSLRNAK